MVSGFVVRQTSSRVIGKNMNEGVEHIYNIPTFIQSEAIEKEHSVLHHFCMKAI